MSKRFDVFLSHNSKDKPAVQELEEALQKCGIEVWLDEWELVPGRPWQEALEEIIETTGASAVLVGKDGLGPWQDREMRGCLSEFVNRNLPVIPVLLPGAPERPVLPIFLSGLTWVDLREGLTDEGAGPFGALDQAGNVREWCEDVWDAEAYRKRDGKPNPVSTTGDPAVRCLRGGS